MRGSVRYASIYTPTMTTDRGAVLVVDERVADTFVAPGDEIERMMYGWSVLCCLPSGMSERNSAATGCVIRETPSATTPRRRVRWRRGASRR